MNWKRLREKVLEKYYPEESDLKELENKYAKLSEFIEDQNNLNTHFAGSAGRQTCMKGDNDIDIFVLFPEGKNRSFLEEKGLEIGKKVFNEFNGEYRIEYAEHPYTKGVIDGTEVEIVPCFETDPEDIKSNVDRTPHHSRWVEEHLSQEQRKDVVVLKAFLSANNLYGSSLKIRGFSGYLCEILIQEFGDFRNLVENAANWKERQYIDPGKHFQEPEKDLEGKFESENLVVIDPVDSGRNVASVITKQKYAKFVHLCWKFSKQPGFRFFEKEEIDVEEFAVKQELKKRGDIIVLEFDNIDTVEDVVYPQMRKTVGLLEKKIRKHDFQIYSIGFHIGESTRIIFEVEDDLPEIEIIEGPKVFHGNQHLEEFSSRYKITFVEGDRLKAKTEREFTRLQEFLQEFLSADLEKKGVPSNIAEELRSYRFADPLTGDEEWLKYLTEKFHIE